MAEAGSLVVDVAVAGLRAPSLDIDPMIVLKPFVTKAYQQRVKSRTVGEEPSNTPDYVLQQARQAHERNMLDLCNPAMLRQRASNTQSMVRLQAEDYLRQRNALLDDNDDDDDGDDYDSGGGVGCGAKGDNSVVRNNGDGARAAMRVDTASSSTETGSSDIPQIAQIHHRSDSNTGGEEGESDQEEEEEEGKRPCSAAALCSTAVPVTPSQPSGHPGNSRADDLLNRYRQFDRASAGSYGSFTFGGSPAGASELSVRAGRPHLLSYVPVAPSFSRESLGRAGSKTGGGGGGFGPDFTRAYEQRSPRLPMDPDQPAADSPVSGPGGVGAGARFQAAGGASPSNWRAQSGAQGVGHARELPLRGASCTSLMRPGSSLAPSLTGGAGEGSTPPPGSGAELYTRSARSLTVLYEQSAVAGFAASTCTGPEGEGRGAANVASPNALSPTGHDKSVRSRLLASRLTAPSSGTAVGSGSAQPGLGLVGTRTTEPSIRAHNGLAGGGGGGSRRTTDSEPVSLTPQLPDLGSASNCAAAALFRAITGAEAVGRAQADVPERSWRSFHVSPQLQHQFLYGQSAGAGGVAGAAPGEGAGSLRVRNTISNMEVIGVQKSSSSVGKLPRIGASSMSSSSGAPAQTRLSSHSMKQPSREGTPTGYLSAAKRAPAGGEGHPAVDGRPADEAGIVSKVKGLFGILKR